MVTYIACIDTALDNLHYLQQHVQIKVYTVCQTYSNILDT